MARSIKEIEEKRLAHKGRGATADSLSAPQAKTPSPEASAGNSLPTQPQHAPPAANSNYVTIPDANFRQCLKSLVPNAFSGDQMDADHPSVRGLTVMGVTGKHIQSLEGIAYFTALTSLACYGNQLTSLDVSHNTALTYLDCAPNQLTNLVIGKNTALTSLYCNNNQLTRLDVSKNTALTSLQCQHNQLTRLDASQSTSLTNLYCYDNRLIDLDLRGIKAISTLGIYSSSDAKKVLKTLRLSEALKDHAEIQKVKKIRGSSVRISTYTDLGILTCYNYNPVVKACAVLYGPIHTTKALLDRDAPAYQTDREAQIQCYNDKPLTVYLPKKPGQSRSMVICAFKGPVSVAVPKGTDQPLSYKGETLSQLSLTAPARPYGFHWNGTIWQVQ